MIENQHCPVFAFIVMAKPAETKEISLNSFISESSFQYLKFRTPKEHLKDFKMKLLTSYNRLKGFE